MLFDWFLVLINNEKFKKRGLFIKPMRRGIIVLLIVLLAVLSIPFALGVDAELRNLDGICDGNANISMMHYGKPIKTSEIVILANFTATEYSAELKGDWEVTGQESADYIYQDSAKVFFRTTNNPFKKEGNYEIHFLFYPKTEDYHRTDVAISLYCPGVSCTSDNECDFDSECSGNICKPLSCKRSEFIEFHRCTPKCNDFQECTIDRFENNGCVYEKNLSCCIKDEDCSTGNACLVEKCVQGTCIRDPIVCESANDKCVTSTCIETKGCIYETDEQCLADENEKRDYLIVIGQPKVYKQPFWSRISNSIGTFFRNLF
jgi:hypothetical protein